MTAKTEEVVGQVDRWFGAWRKSEGLEDDGKGQIQAAGMELRGVV